GELRVELRAAPRADATDEAEPEIAVVLAAVGSCRIERRLDHMSVRASPDCPLVAERLATPRAARFAAGGDNQRIANEPAWTPARPSRRLSPDSRASELGAHRVAASRVGAPALDAHAVDVGGGAWTDGQVADVARDRLGVPIERVTIPRTRLPTVVPDVAGRERGAWVLRLKHLERPPRL